MRETRKTKNFRNKDRRQCQTGYICCGIFSSHELTFFDVRISNQNAPSNRSLTLSAVYSKNEKEKMKAYGDRVLQVEKGLFVFSPEKHTTVCTRKPGVSLAFNCSKLTNHSAAILCYCAAIYRLRWAKDYSNQSPSSAQRV